jgi:pilus assembly protein FimV
MGKRLAPALAALVLLLPVAAHALGLGNMTMNSALNQPLDAKIELLSVQSGDLANLSISLGTNEDFERVGVVREFFYTEFKFAVTKKPDGSSYIQVTTRKPIVEPFLDFVVEARWARGRILREFTVLVDPPALSAEAPAPVQQAATAPTPAPQVSRQAPIQKSAPPAPIQQAAQPAIQQPVQPAPIRERAELMTEPMNRDDLNYGLIKYKDTLFDIANKMRSGDVTTNQMMLALARNNPKAFYNGNINQMKAGFVLRIDDRETLTSLSEVDAKVEVNRHHVEWIARKSGKIIRQTSEAPAGGKVSRGDKPAGKRSAEEQARLKLVAPGTEGAGSGVGDEDMGRMREDLLLAAEALDANKQETDELKNRMLEMEEQLESMQRLIMLKDDEMMAIQKQFGKEKVAEQAEGTPEALLETTPDTAATDEETKDMPAEGDAAAENPAEMASAPKPKFKPAPLTEPGIVDELMSMLDDPMIMYGGIGLLVLIIGLVVYKKRKGSGDSFEESILNVGATAESMEDSNESSMVSDFAMSEMSGMSGLSADAADVDPVSEADVYLAYGRHQQAEEILTESLANDPDRHDVKLKLLEVFFAAKNSDAFEKGAQELHDAIGDESDPLWAKAVTMGQQLCPDNSLFGGSSDAAPQEDSSDAAEEGAVSDVADASEDDLLDFDFDIDSAGDDDGIDDVFAELEAATAGSEVADDSKSDEPDDSALDLDTPLEPDAAAAPAEEEDNSLDFDMGESTVADTSTESKDDIGDLSGDAFGEVDEVGTKLDLAKAYVDMGDSDGARSILEEVIEEGDESQKAQANELLRALG